MAAISFQQNIVRVVHLEVVQGGPLNTVIPNTCLQQPMSGKPGLPPRYIVNLRVSERAWKLFAFKSTNSYLLMFELVLTNDVTCFSVTLLHLYTFKTSRAIPTKYPYRDHRSIVCERGKCKHVSPFQICYMN